mmetsp:Transcript_4555/g.8186  ORF Transcript_4555/g.8186 Transcript_4555/m.8186 type:complete len:83 (-) Transcript_4555:559-807(-)
MTSIMVPFINKASVRHAGTQLTELPNLSFVCLEGIQETIQNLGLVQKFLNLFLGSLDVFFLPVEPLLLLLHGQCQHSEEVLI